MKSLLLSVLCPLLALISPGHALEPAEIRKLAAEPHDRENLLPELKIFPDAREYKVTSKSWAPGEKAVETPGITAREKAVQGRYIVSEILGEGGKTTSYMVVTFDKKDGVFKKWILMNDEKGSFGSYTGVGDLEKRSIAWVIEAPDHSSVILGLEVHADDKTTWSDTILQGGKVVNRSEGIAIRTK